MLANETLNHSLKISYEQALIDCINGELRMQWGKEIFSGKCEPLGSAELNKRGT